MGTRIVRTLVVVAASTMLFACTESDTEGLDASVNVDASLQFDARGADGPLADAAPAVDAPPPPDGPPPIDAFITDAYAVGDAGQTVTKSYHFTLGLEDLAQSFATDGASMKWNAADGDPPGSLQFTAVKTDEAQGTVKGQTPFFSWEDWGVPAGAQVVYVGMTSYKRHLEAVVNMDHYWAFQIVGDLGESVHAGKDGGPYLEIASLTTTPQPMWETVTEGLQNYEVKPLYRASNTRLHVKAWWFPSRSGAIDWRLDEIQLEIVYVMP